MRKEEVLHEPFNAGLGALHGHLIHDMLPTSVHRMIVNGFKGTKNLRPDYPCQFLELKAQRH
jgi:hypothetical protein